MKIDVMDKWAVLAEDDTLRQNSTKTYYVDFVFDRSWDGYAKTAIFEAGPASVSIDLTEDRCAIPAECLKRGSVKLKIGIYGVKGEERKDTVWCLAGVIIPSATVSIGGSFPGGALPGEPSAVSYGRLITVALPAGNWIDMEQKVEDELLLADGRYCYLVGGDADCFEDCCEAGVKGENVTVDGEIIIRCKTVPEIDLSVNILRLEVKKE